MQGANVANDLGAMSIISTYMKLFKLITIYLVFYDIEADINSSISLSDLKSIQWEESNGSFFNV